jgi:hypothetical protein
MDTERDPQFGRVRLPGSAESAAPGEQASEPDYLAPASPRGRSGKVGIHQVRRMSNWTAAALIVATGATTVALAHNAFPVGVPAAAVASGSTGALGTAAAQGGNGPQVSHSVATTSASGVTTTTTTRVVNGKTVVTKVRHVPAYQDN